MIKQHQEKSHHPPSVCYASIQSERSGRGVFCRRVVLLTGLFWAVLMTAACSTTRVIPTEDIWDPIEPVNRAIFAFNEGLDRHVAEPVARAYDNNAPEPVKRGIGNFFRNLRQPIDVVNALLQAKFKQAFFQTGRFVLNSTVGVLGFIDVATPQGIPRQVEDFGITLAHWGIPPGPYIVLPIMGPSNLRDTVGIVGDGFADPIYAVEYTNMDEWEKLSVEIPLKTVQFISKRAELIQAIDAARMASVDYYFTLQGAYYQSRRADFYGGKPPSDIDQDEQPVGIIMK